MKSSNRLTMKNIAEMAEVDKSIVSKVINGAKSIPASPEKIRHVRLLIEKYQYTPLGAAQSLATHRTNQIEFLLSSTTEALYANPAFGQMFCGVVKACRANRYQCLADINDFTGIKKFVVPENMRRRNIDGCILAGNISDEMFEKIAEMEIPMVVLGGEYVKDRVPSVTWNSFEAFSELFGILSENGHERIWFADDSANIRNRFRQMNPEKRGLQIEILDSCGNNEIARAHIFAERFASLPKNKRPTLIWGCDQFCCSLVGSLAKKGFCCPRDFSILCSSETEMSECFNPPLSTFSQNFMEVGYNGGLLMIEILKKKLNPRQAIQLAEQYVVKGFYHKRDSISNLKEGSI